MIKRKFQAVTFIRKAIKWSEIRLSFRSALAIASPWLFGILLGSVVTKAVDITWAKLSYTEYLLLCEALMLGIVMCFMIYLLDAIAEYTDEVRRSHGQRVAVHTTKTGSSGFNAFSFCEAVVNSARESIVIVGPHFTDNVKIDTTDHTSYLERGVDQCITRHRADRSENKTFEYLRVVQLDRDKFDGFRNGISEHGGIADMSIFADEGLASHVKKTLENQDQSVVCRVWAREFVPSFPSILVVDSRHLFFSLPSMSSSGASDKFQYDVVFHVEDLSGEIPTFFSQLAKRFESGVAVAIKGVKSTGESAT